MVKWLQSKLAVRLTAGTRQVRGRPIEFCLMWGCREVRFDLNHGWTQMDADEERLVSSGWLRGE